MNAYFICVIVRVQMWCVYAQSYMDQTKKIFDHFICIWKCFYHSLFLSFVLNFFFNVLSLFCCWKTGVRVFRESFVSCSRLGYESWSWKMHFWHSGRNFREYLTSNSWVHSSQNSQISYFMGILWVFGPKLLIWLFYDSILSKPSFSKLLH